MEKGGMSAREKGDIYWRKRKRYLAAAAVIKRSKPRENVSC